MAAKSKKMIIPIEVSAMLARLTLSLLGNLFFKTQNHIKADGNRQVFAFAGQIICSIPIPIKIKPAAKAAFLCRFHFIKNSAM